MADVTCVPHFSTDGLWKSGLVDATTRLILQCSFPAHS